MTSVADEQRSSRFQASDALFRALFEQSPLSVQILSQTGETIAVNPAWERLWGVSLTDLPGYNILEDPQLSANGVEPILRRAFAGDPTTIPPIPFVPDRGTYAGQTRWARAFASPIRDETGAVAQVVLIHEDVTNLVAAEEGLARLAAIVESSNDAIISRSLDGAITTWNRGAERLYGYTPEEAVGLHVSVLVPPDREEELSIINERLTRGERMEHFETVRLRKDGSRVDVSIGLSPISDPTSRIIGVSTIARDVSGRKRAEAAERFLARASAELTGSLDYKETLGRIASLAVPDLADWCVIHLVDADGALRPLVMAQADPSKAWLARELEQLYPPALDAPVGPPRVLRTGEGELVHEITDDQLAAYAQDAEHLRLLQAVAPRSYVAVPLSARGRSLGTISFVAAESDRRFGPDDLALAAALGERAAAAIDNARLYEEAQAAEARFRGLFEGVADAILVADVDRRYVDANAAATGLLGYHREELLQLRVEDVVTAGPAWTEAEYTRYVDEGHWHGELELRRKDGTRVPVEARATVVNLPTGQVFLSAIRDVSARRTLEREQQEFLEAVSHDLKNPLTAVRGQAQHLRRLLHRGLVDPPDKLTRALDAIEASATRMRVQLDELQDLARLRAGHPLELQAAPTDLVALVRSAAADAQAT
ncbi:MAG: PAS domain S-box protein, partial [Chloroflexota bacterium]|nr:PAS domain S-box protein [Chloroflexota bacterium]